MPTHFQPHIYQLIAYQLKLKHYQIITTTTLSALFQIEIESNIYSIINITKPKTYAYATINTKNFK